MDDDDIRHWQHLIEEYTRYLRIREEQAAGYGKLECPPHIVTGIEDATQQINELEQRIRRRIRHAGETGVFYSTEEVDEIYERTARITQLELTILMHESTIKTSKISFGRRRLGWKTKLYMGLSAVFVLFYLVRVTVDILSLNFGELWQRSLIASLLILGYIALLFFVSRRTSREPYIKVVDLEKDLQDKKDKLQIQKSELNKIYKVAE